ncbi:MAG TPA: sulfatase-like hydrolase/transferase [Halococcus sp.]|nr:sulfatase-like hydrolase/transferase [Halococcus sp.]
MAQIALVVLDTLRKDVFDEQFSWLPGKRFENAWSTSHWTVPAHASLFTGKYASDIGVHARSHHLDCDDPTLAESLKRQGYRTTAFSANGHIVPYFDFDRGFDEFVQYGRADRNEDDLFPWSEYLSSTNLPTPLSGFGAFWHSIIGAYDTRQSFAKLRWGLQQKYPSLLGVGATSVTGAHEFVRDMEFSDDEFLFLNLMEVHAPYLSPRKYHSERYSSDDVMLSWRETFSNNDDGDYETVRQAYTDSARYLSNEYHKLFDELSSFDYVVTLSDHGEMFGEDGIVEHCYGVSPELTHIPLVVSGQTIDDETVTAPVSIIDVHRTVLDAASVDSISNGQSLLGDFESRDCLTEYHGFTHKDRLESLRAKEIDPETITAYDEPRYGLVRGSSYIYETFDDIIVNGDSDETELRAALMDARESANPPKYEDNDIEDDVHSRLEKLGYV